MSPEPRGDGPSAVRGRDLLLLAALGLLGYLPGIASRDLWNPDEPRYAEVAREMVATGQYFVPHLNGELYAHKPPLHFWTIALMGALRGGVDEVAARLPAVFALCASLGLVYALGCLLFSRSTGLLAAAIFATTGRMLWQGRVGQIDMTLTCLVLLAGTCFAWGYFAGRPRLYAGLFVAGGLGTLAKGPVGLLPPLLVAIIFLLIERDYAQLRALRVVRGLSIWAGFLLLWLGPAIAQAGFSYARTLVVDQTLRRYAAAGSYEGTIGHLKPWYYFLLTVPADFMPFTLLLPLALPAAFAGASPMMRARLRFLVVWIATTLVFFSLSSGKRSVYVIAVHAPLALLCAWGVERLRGLWPRRRWLLVAAFGCLFAAAAAAPMLVPRAAERSEQAPLLGEQVVRTTTAVLALPAAGALVALFAAARGRYHAAFYAVAAGMALTSALAARFVLPHFDQFKSARAPAQALLLFARPEEPWTVYPEPDAGFAFYSGRFLTTVRGEDNLYRFVAEPGRRFLFIEQETLARLPRPLGMVELARGAEGHVLLTTPPWPRAESSSPPAASSTSGSAR